MISNVSSSTPTQPAAQPKPVTAKMTQSKPQQTSKDTVQVSSAAQAALMEATETSVQTAKEASAGDHQAQRLLAKEAAAKGAGK
jgi:hypothetical protein